MKRFSALLIACLTVAILVPPAQATFPTVTITDFLFDPDPIDTTLGVSVAWHNTSTVLVHTATSDVRGFFNTGGMTPQTTDLATLIGAGIYPYHCRRHPTLMQARVRVPLQTDTTAIVLGGSATLTFASGDTTGLTFDLQRRVDGGDWVTKKTGLAGPTRIVTPKVAGTFEYRVRTVNANGRTKWSPKVTIVVSET